MVRLTAPDHEPRPVITRFGMNVPACRWCREPLVHVRKPCPICEMASGNEHSPQCPKSRVEEIVFPYWRHAPRARAKPCCG